MPVQKIKKGHLDVWDIKMGSIRAQISQQGAQLLSYGKHEEPQIIWGNPHAEYMNDVPVRGGIPVCFPWFGDFTQNPDAVKKMAIQGGSDLLPFHGLVRQSVWDFEGLNETGGQVTMTFSLGIKENDYFAWRHNCHIKIEYIISDNLQVTLTVCNPNNYPLSVTLALHSYYHVSDVESIKLKGLASHKYYDALDAWSLKNQDEEPFVNEEMARTFTDRTGDIAIIDPYYRRKIVITSLNSSSCVLWNPYDKRALQLDQFSGEAWKEMLCIETARVKDDYLAVPPNSTESVMLLVSTQIL
ncbi:D-hexose-6-phosphate mutarotase [Leclercia adecarboxylata]|uniref:D-hexose-6-phosphate mutarotase n=1 Tax=Leclercia adecarboxylata TaxID=83655 RepID=UPI00202A42EC|nr:D-hexose-6-phosphate mutarotase [Leclercia adecarboxylata]URN97437.1 D-hexose-6-phosphate mutarotase [Leclercia adecarboxylata]